MVGVYINGDIEAKLERMRGWMEEKDTGVKTVIEGGDFNARTGREGGGVMEDDWEVMGGDGRRQKIQG